MKAAVPLHTRRRRRMMMGLGFVAGAVLAVGLVVVWSMSGTTNTGIADLQRVKAVDLVEDDSAFCHNLLVIPMTQRVETSSLHSEIMPDTVPEEHFAEDAYAIVRALPGDYSKAHSKAVEYDTAVQARCTRGSN